VGVEVRFAEMVAGGSVAVVVEDDNFEDFGSCRGADRASGRFGTHSECCHSFLVILEIDLARTLDRNHRCYRCYCAACVAVVEVVADFGECDRYVGVESGVLDRALESDLGHCSLCDPEGPCHSSISSYCCYCCDLSMRDMFFHGIGHNFVDTAVVGVDADWHRLFVYIRLYYDPYQLVAEKNNGHDDHDRLFVCFRLYFDPYQIVAEKNSGHDGHDSWT